MNSWCNNVTWKRWLVLHRSYDRNRNGSRYLRRRRWKCSPPRPGCSRTRSWTGGWARDSGSSRPPAPGSSRAPWASPDDEEITCYKGTQTHTGKGRGSLGMRAHGHTQAKVGGHLVWGHTDTHRQRSGVTWYEGTRTGKGRGSLEMMAHRQAKVVTCLNKETETNWNQHRNHYYHQHPPEPLLLKQLPPTPRPLYHHHCHHNCY